MYYQTRLTSVPFSYTPDPDDIVASLEAKGVDFVVVTTDGWNSPSLRFLVPAIQAHPERFVLIASITDPSGQPTPTYPYVAAAYRFVREAQPRVPAEGRGDAAPR